MRVTSQDPWDYGWMRNYNQGGAGGASYYYGPPHSMWYPVLMLALIGICAAVM